MFVFLYMLVLGLCCTSVSSEFFLDRPRLSIPSEALVKGVVDFMCEIPNQHNDSILLKLFKKGDRKLLYGEYTLPNRVEVGVFPKVIKLSYEGYFECEASVQNNTQINATVSQTHYLKVIEPVKGAEIDPSGPIELFEESNLELLCKVKAGNHLSYKWLLDGRLISPSPFHRMTDNRLQIYRASSKDSGSYRCSASNVFNKTQVFTSNSSDVLVTVKELVSNPNIFFTVIKEDNHTYSAVITCQSERGTLPITFSLHNTTGLIHNETTQERRATFKVPVVLDQHLGWLVCHANNGNETMYSHWLPLQIVPVGGPVTIRSQFETAENYAVTGLWFYCKAAKGSHPHFQWFLNKTLLSKEGNFYYVFDQLPERSILWLSAGRSAAGTYHCQVSDSFDNTTFISSERRYVDKEELNRLPVFVVAVVFGCFTLMITLVTFCCLFGVMFRRRQFGEKSLLNLEMNEQVAADGDEKELSINSEDPDEIKAPSEHEFYQDSEESVDEWPETEQERNSLEDEIYI